MKIPEPAAEILRATLERLRQPLLDKEKELSQCSSAVKKLVADGIAACAERRYGDAIRQFAEVIRQEPKYTRVRLQLLNLYKHEGQPHMVVSLGGNSLAYATEPHTRCQIYTLMGDAVSQVFHRHRDNADRSDIDAAVEFYRLAFHENKLYPIPIWNCAELLYKGDRKEESRIWLNRLVDCIRESQGQHARYVERIIADARELFRTDELEQDYIKRMEGANCCILPPRPPEDEGLLRFFLKAAAALAIALAPLALPNDSEPTSPVKPPSRHQESIPTKSPESATLSQPQPSPSSVKVAGVDIEPIDLSLVDIKPIDLALVDIDHGDLA